MRSSSEGIEPVRSGRSDGLAARGSCAVSDPSRCSLFIAPAASARARGDASGRYTARSSRPYGRMSAPSHRFQQQPLGIRRKLAIAFVTIAAGVIALAAFSIVNLVRVGVDARRFQEEDREAKLAFRLLAELEPLEALAPEEVHEGVALDVARDASRLLGEIFEGASAADPSDRGHQEAEDRIADRLAEALDRLVDQPVG